MDLTQPDFPASVRRRIFLATGAAFATIGAILTWGATAQIATSVTIPGTVSSAQPVVPIQREVSGRVAKVHVSALAVVHQGDVLFTFDTADARTQLTAVSRQIAMLDDEVLAIAGGPTQAPVGASDTTGVVGREIADQRKAHDADMARVQAETVAALRESAALSGDILQQERLVSLQENNQIRADTLAEKGAKTLAERDIASEKLIAAQTLLLEKQSAKRAAADRVALLNMQARSLDANFRAELSARLRSATERLVDLRRKQAELQRQVAQALLTSPIDGTIAELKVQAAGQVVGAGEVLAEIAAPLQSVEIELTIPPRYVDQVTVGQKGVIMFPALPQRRMPRIEVTVTGLAGAAERDREGKVTTFLAKARANLDDLRAAARLLGADYRLMRDMPVVVLLQGHTISPLGYFLQPARDIGRLAFEEG